MRAPRPYSFSTATTRPPPHAELPAPTAISQAERHPASIRTLGLIAAVRQVIDRALPAGQRSHVVGHDCPTQADRNRTGARAGDRARRRLLTSSDGGRAALSLRRPTRRRSARGPRTASPRKGSSPRPARRGCPGREGSSQRPMREHRDRGCFRASAGLDAGLLLVPSSGYATEELGEARFGSSMRLSGSGASTTRAQGRAQPPVLRPHRSHQLAARNVIPSRLTNWLLPPLSMYAVPSL